MLKMQQRLYMVIAAKHAWQALALFANEPSDREMGARQNRLQIFNSFSHAFQNRADCGRQH